MRRSAAIIATVGVWCWCATGRAAPPDVKFLFPAGAQAGTTVDVEASGSLKPWPVKAWVSGEGVTFEPSKKEGAFTATVAADVAPDVRWVRFYNDEGSSPPRAFVIGSVPEIVETETNDLTGDKAGILERPTVVNGKLAKAGDSDAFQVRIPPGRTLVASIESHGTFGSPVDCVLQLATTGGFIVAQNHDERGLDPCLVFTNSNSTKRSANDDVYLLRVFGIAADPNTSIRYFGAEAGIYRLTLGCGPTIDHAFPPVVEAGKPANVKLEGWNVSSDQASAKVSVSSGEGEVSALRLPSTTSSSPDAAVGRAFVTGVDVPTLVEQEPNSLERPQAIVPPVVVNGRIDQSGDADAFSIRGKKGDSLRICVVSKRLGLPVDPLLRILKPDGSEVVRFDDAGRGDPDIDTVWRVPEDGEYLLLAQDLFGAASVRHVYALDVRPVGSDFALSIAMGELSGAAGKPIDVTVDVARPAGMSGDIELRIEGLPKDATGTTGVSTGKGDAAKKVVLKPVLKGPFSGPIRIVGTLKDSKVSRTVRIATPPAFGLPPPVDVWLTVKAK